MDSLDVLRRDYSQSSALGIPQESVLRADKSAGQGVPRVRETAEQIQERMRSRMAASMVLTVVLLSTCYTHDDRLARFYQCL
jgi:hypothetical protein